MTPRQLLAALEGLPPAAVCGRGAGLDDAGLARKEAAVTIFAAAAAAAAVAAATIVATDSFHC